MQGIRDTLAGAKSAGAPGDALDRRRTAGPRSTAARSTPTTTSRARCSRWRTSSASIRDLDAFIPTGGFPQFVPHAYRQRRREAQGAHRRQVARARRRRHAAGADGPAEGRPVAGPGRPAAVRDGLQDHATPCKDMKDGKPRPPTRPIPASTSARPPTPTPASPSSFSPGLRDSERRRPLFPRLAPGRFFPAVEIRPPGRHLPRHCGPQPWSASMKTDASRRELGWPTGRLYTWRRRRRGSATSSG